MVTANCPFCRAPLSGSHLSDETLEEQFVKRLRASAERGDKVAQLEFGLMYKDGRFGIGPDVAQAGLWFQRSAEQGHGRALCELGQLHDDIDTKSNETSLLTVGIKKSVNDAFRCYQASAFTSYLNGLSACGMALITRGETKEALRYYTLAADKGCELSQLEVALDRRKQNVGNNLERSKYWLEKCAPGGDGSSQYLMSAVLADLTKRRYKKHNAICFARDNSLTRSILFARRANFPNARSRVLAGLDEQDASSACATCYKKLGQNPNNSPAPLLRCSRCKAAWYCSKSCQVQHYKGGHKRVCNSG